jgi:hypothetical protein
VLGANICLTSESWKHALANGLMDGRQCDVIEIDMTGTEEIYFATVDLDVGMNLVRWGSDQRRYWIERYCAPGKANSFAPVGQRGKLVRSECLILAYTVLA